MNDLSLDIAGRTSFEPGEEITVLARWTLDGPPKAVDLRVVWNTTGKGTAELEVVDGVRFDSPPAEDSRHVTLTLPREPYSFRGQLVSLTWALELVALPSLASTRLEIVIGPDAKAANLLELCSG
jgi:hypothetical protein